MVRHSCNLEFNCEFTYPMLQYNMIEFGNLPEAHQTPLAGLDGKRFMDLKGVNGGGEGSHRYRGGKGSSV